MDGWGGALASAMRTALSGETAGTVSLRARPVGAGLEVSGQFEVRALGARLEDEAEGEYVETFDSSLLLMREAALLTVCVAVSEIDRNRVSLYDLAATCRAAALDKGFRDPTFVFQEPVYPERSEGELNVVCGFEMSARVQARLA